MFFSVRAPRGSVDVRMHSANNKELQIEFDELVRWRQFIAMLSVERTEPFISEIDLPEDIITESQIIKIALAFPATGTLAYRLPS